MTGTAVLVLFCGMTNPIGTNGLAITTGLAGTTGTNSTGGLTGTDTFLVY